MGGAHNIYVRNKEEVSKFGQEIQEQESTWKHQVQIKNIKTFS